MLPTNGNGSSYIKYREKDNIDIYTNNTKNATIDAGGGLTVTGDIEAVGGFPQTLTFVANSVVQAGFPYMTSSIASASDGKAGTNWYMAYTRVPVMRPGSIRGLVLYTQDGIVKSGSLSASVTVDGTNVACTLGMHTGTYGTKLVSKDTLTFTAGQAIGVSLSASSAYLCEPNTTSASFMASVLVEL